MVKVRADARLKDEDAHSAPQTVTRALRSKGRAT